MSLVNGPNGQWTLDIAPGWAFVNNKEVWHSHQSTTTSATSILGSGVISILDINFLLGPINVFDSNSNYYVPVLGTTSVNKAYTWSQVGTSNIWSSTITTGSYILAVHKQITGSANYQVPIALAPSSGYLVADTYFTTGTTIYTYAQSNPGSSLLIQEQTATPSLYYQELLEVKEGYLYPQYSERSNITLSCLTSSQTTTGVSTGPIVAPFSLANGSMLKAEYYVPYSYCPSGSGVAVYTHPSSAKSVQVNYPLTPFNLKHYCSQFTEYSTNTLNLNPLVENAIRSGYIGAEQAVNPSPTEVTITFNKPSYCYTWGEEVQARISVFGPNGLPIPGMGLSLTVSGVTVTGVYPASSITSQRGERLLLLTTTASSFTITCIAGTVTSIASLTGYTSGQILTSGGFNTPVPAIAQGVTVDQEDMIPIYTSLSRLDGVPVSGSATFKSKAKIQWLNGVFGTAPTRQTASVNYSITSENIWGVEKNLRLEHTKPTLFLAYTTSGFSREVKIEPN